MKEAIVSKGPSGAKVTLVDSPIPTPGPDQVLIKVVVSGTNPKDWKIPQEFDMTLNQGDDIAGLVEKVGADVYEFAPGDRVAAFHQMSTPHGSYAEYAIAPANTTFHIPEKTTFEEAAAIPLAGMTAAVALYRRLGLPQPFTPMSAGTKMPLVIYGASTAVGNYAIQLAQRSNIHPLICIAGRAAPYVETFIDHEAGDTVIDYRAGEAAVVREIKACLGGGDAKVYHALDCVSEKGSQKNFMPVLGPGAKATFVLQGPLEDGGFPEGTETSRTFVGEVHQTDDARVRDFGFVYFRLMARGLQEGWFKAQRHEVVPAGLGGVQAALDNLMAGKASAVKYVLRIADTEGLGK